MTMESNCPVCKKPYDGVVCTQCTVTDLDMGGLMAGEGLQLKSEDASESSATAFLVDLVSNRKIPITTPRCKVGRDDLNDIVISGDQSISRFHFVITRENNQYMVQDGKSRHGTFLNGNQITVPEPIHDGDVLKVGVSLFWFVIETAVVANTPEKFAPVDVSSMEQQQELEFVLPEPSNHEGTREMDIPKALNVSINPKGDAPKKPVDQSEITVAMLLDPLQQQELNKAVSKAAEKQSESAKGNVKPESVNAEAKSDASKSDATKSDAKSDSPKHKSLSEALESKSSADATETHAKTPDLLSDSIIDSIKESEKAPNVVAPEVKKFTEFDDSYSDQKGFEYSYGINDLFDPLRTVADALSAAREHEEFAPSSDSPANDSILDSGNGESDSASAPVMSDVEIDAKTKENEANEEKESKQDSEKESAKEPVVETAQEFEPTASDEVDVSKFLEEFEPLHAENEKAAEEKAAEESGIAAQSTPSTLDKFAEIIGEVSNHTEKKIEEPASSLKLNFQSSSEKVEREEAKREDEPRVEKITTNGESQTSNGAKGMSIVKEAGSSTVPDWCKKYFSSELNSLSKELTELNEQVRLAQQKIKEVESRVALTKGLRNTLLTAQGEELVEACGKVLTMLGWRVKISEEDKHELRLDTSEDKNVSIARIVWTESQADRTHLGQLSISQTRYWCEQGVEPKGILLVCKSGETAPSPLNSSDFNSELAEYASKKNVCLMTTLQLLSVYKEIALHDGSAETVRATILASSGWLPGFNLEPGAESADKEESSGTNKLSSLLSA
jgi:pSer/pThr/pTyr-binding forkhead associated (FHA) protein